MSGYLRHGICSEARVLSRGAGFEIVAALRRPERLGVHEAPTLDGADETLVGED
jgi:hypothetical protein